MNTRIILFAGVLAAFSSCTTAYRTGQTPDDVYYSPARETEAYVQVERQNDYRGGNNYSRDNSGSGYGDYYEHPEDRYLRMMVRNRYRWSAFDDYSMMSWRYNPYHSFSPYYSFGTHFGYSPMNSWGYSGYNSYWNWNNYYNPYYAGVVIVNPKVNPAAYQKLRNFNPGAYTNKSYYNNRPALTNRYYTTPSQSRPANPKLGSSIKKVFKNGNDRSSNGRYSPGSATERPTRTYTPERSTSSPSPVRSSPSGGSSRSSGGGVSRPSRGN